MKMIIIMITTKLQSTFCNEVKHAACASRRRRGKKWCLKVRQKDYYLGDHQDVSSKWTSKHRQTHVSQSATRKVQMSTINHMSTASDQGHQWQAGAMQTSILEPNSWMQSLNWTGQRCPNVIFHPQVWTKVANWGYFRSLMDGQKWPVYAIFRPQGWIKVVLTGYFPSTPCDWPCERWLRV